MTPLQRVWGPLDEELDGAPGEPLVQRLGGLRIFVGALLLVRTTPLLHLVPGLYENHGGPLFGWPDGELHAGLAGITLPVIVIQTCVVLRTIAAVLFVLGVFARPAGLAAALLGYVVWSQEPFSFIFTLHVLYLSTALLALTDAVSSRALRPSPIRSVRSSIALLRAFILSIYAWSAIGKLHHRWLDGTVLRVLRDGRYVTGPIAGHLLRSEAGLRAAAWATLLLEVAVVPLLFFRRTRAAGVALACTMHGIFEISLHPDVFGWLLVGLLVVFWPRARHLPAI